MRIESPEQIRRRNTPLHGPKMNSKHEDDDDVNPPRLPINGTKLKHELLNEFQIEHHMHGVTLFVET